MSSMPEIKGWCPTAYQPMESGDGLLIRAKTIGARIDSSRLKAVAHIAKTFGNGLIDLTQRAQLQIRGLQAESLAGALMALSSAGLLAPDANRERVANILTPPLAGLDQTALLDAVSLTSELATGLMQDTSLYALPSKFLFAISDGGAMPIDVAEADISFHPAAEGRIALRLAGAEDVAVFVIRSDAVPVALKLARAFLALRAADPFGLRRMRKLINKIGVGPLILEAGLALSTSVPLKADASASRLGVHDAGKVIFAGVSAPFGRWRARELENLADAAIAHGLGEARLTPWRTLLFPALSRGDAADILGCAKNMNLIVSGDDPRYSVIACPGAPECSQAQGETRKHLERLASMARQYAGKDGVGLHISGCSKGCARQRITPITLVLADGRYNLVVNGCAQDTPICRGLALHEIESSLKHYVRNKAPCPAN